MASTSRFASINESEAAAIRGQLHSKDTIKSNKNAASLLKTYLKEKGENPEFELMNAEELNHILKTFYLNARKTDGNK